MIDVAIRHPREVGQRMTWRARAYLIVVGLRHLGTGGFALFGAHLFQSHSFDTIETVLPLRAWGVLFLFIAVHAFLAVVFEHEWWARLVICSSAAITAMWAAGFMGAVFRGESLSPLGPIIWSSLTLKDLVIAAMPLRSPFERLLSEPVEA